jgi:hypothetical protein
MVTGSSDSTVIDCPFCRTKIRYTVPESVKTYRGDIHELSPYENAILDSEVKFSKTLPMIYTIAMKDIERLKYIFIAMLFIGVFLAILLYPLSKEIYSYNTDDEYYYDEYWDGLSPEEQARELEYRKAYENEEMTGFYGIFLILIVVILGIVINYNYGWEIRRGTMRMLSLYPIDMNGLTLAKLLSAAVIIGIIQFCLLVLPFITFIRPGVTPYLLKVHVVAYAMNIFILATAAFGSQIITNFTGKLTFSMNRLAAIMIVIYFFCTETIITFFGVFITELRNIPFDEQSAAIAGFTNLGKSIGQISPYHSGGRILSSSIGFYSGGPDLHFILLIGVLLIFFGYLAGKKIYPDIFIRE